MSAAPPPEERSGSDGSGTDRTDGPVPHRRLPTESLTGRRRPTEAEARALASTVRLRIIRLCLDESLSNKQIAAALRRDPATVLHHVRRLVDTGFLAAEPARRGPRGAREVPYRSTGKSWRLRLGEGRARDEQSRVLLETFLEELSEVGGVPVDSSRLGLRLNAEHRAELSDRIGRLLDEFAARGPDPDGDYWSVYLAVHADPRARR